jgi:hypothetical protein
VCVSGNVWYDYPAVNKLGCFSRPTVHALRVVDALQPASRRKFDWNDFDSQLGVCLRLSKEGFKQVPLMDTFLQSPPTKLLRRHNASLSGSVWATLGFR